MSNWKIHIYHNDDGSIQVMDGEHFFIEVNPVKKKKKFHMFFKIHLDMKNITEDKVV